MCATRKVVVAVHGIGDQNAFDTVQAVVRQFCKHYRQPATVSLGRLDSDIRSPAGAMVLTPPLDPDIPGNVCFTEVYWADIAREVETKGFRLEDARHWARTVIERLRLHKETVGLVKDEDYERIKLVLQEMINAISVTEFLMMVFKHAGAYKPLLENVLSNYLGDVQLVAEFRTIRARILEAFDEAMRAAHGMDSDVEIHIISHSEGTVVSLLGLLRALQNTQAEPAWVDRVRSFTTLGSPIDKHLILWPELWTEFERGGAWRALPSPIPWANYYDLGDPVGFKLDTARDWLADVGCAAFDFTPASDYGFARSKFPGKAHVDYWSDQELFAHIIGTQISRDPAGPRPAAPATLPSAAAWARVLPYVLAFLPLFVGIYMLYGALDTAMGYGEAGNTLALNALLLALLLGGATVWSRTARLSRHPPTRALAFGFYLLTTGLAVGGLTEGAQDKLVIGWTSFAGDATAEVVIALASAFIAAAGLLFRSYSPLPMLAAGFFVIAWVVGGILLSSEPVASVGPVLTATAALFCLWWLAAIVYDLAFVWHAYIRGDQAVGKLRNFYRRRRTTN